MHFLMLFFLIFCCCHFCNAASEPQSMPAEDLRSTGLLVHMPFFGGGIRNLLHYIRPSVHYGRKSDYRSDFDENYVNYHGGQLWKLIFNGTQKHDGDGIDDNDNYDDDDILNKPVDDFQKFIEKFACVMITAANSSGSSSIITSNMPLTPLFFMRSITNLPAAIWLTNINNTDLYDTTFESLQWLSPFDLRRINIFSPDSTYQINQRYRNRSSVRRYYGYQLWKLHQTELEDHALKIFWRLYGNEVWNINQDGIDILIDYNDIANAKEYMSKTDFSYNIMIDDIETAIDETYIEVNNSNTKAPWLEREGTLMNWHRYHDYGDIQQFMQYTLETYADISEIIQIGVTGHKRPLEVLRISNGNKGNWAIFIDGGLQARDWLSPAAITYAISKLTWLWTRKNSEEIEPDVKLMRNIDWYFLPVANPDGYQYSRITDRLWTKNRHYDDQTGCYGVNLDRNFDFEWGKSGSSSNPCKNLYRGTKKFSEAETRAMRTFLLSMQDYLGAYISYGGYGQAITYPWGDADYVTENQRTLHKVARKAMLNLRRLNQAEYTFGSSYRLKLARSGNSADWVQNRLRPQYVYNVFLKDQGRYGYLMPPHYIVESGEEAYEFMRTIAEELN